MKKLTAGGHIKFVPAPDPAAPPSVLDTALAEANRLLAEAQELVVRLGAAARAKGDDPDGVAGVVRMMERLGDVVHLTKRDIEEAQDDE